MPRTESNLSVPHLTTAARRCAWLLLLALLLLPWHVTRAEPGGAPEAALLRNGSFEEPSPTDSAAPRDWYFLEQAALVADDAPHGQYFLRCANSVPGRGAQAQQHAALDGRQVRALDVSVRVALRDVAPGQSLDERASVRISFYDEHYAAAGEVLLGPWAGTQEWSSETSRVPVPERTRLALVVVGLGGATGAADFDQLSIVPARTNPSARPTRPRP